MSTKSQMVLPSLGSPWVLTFFLILGLPVCGGVALLYVGYDFELVEIGVTLVEIIGVIAMIVLLLRKRSLDHK